MVEGYVATARFGSGVARTWSPRIVDQPSSHVRRITRSGGRGSSRSRGGRRRCSRWHQPQEPHRRTSAACSSRRPGKSPWERHTRSRRSRNWPDRPAGFCRPRNSRSVPPHTYCRRPHSWPHRCSGSYKRRCSILAPPHSSRRRLRSCSLRSAGRGRPHCNWFAPLDR
jgi:hypothetical protein